MNRNMLVGVFFFVIIVLIIAFTKCEKVQAADIVGRSELMICSTMVRQFYEEGFSGMSDTYHQKRCDTTLAINLLDRAADETADLFSCVQRDTFIVIVSGTEWYDLPSDFLRIDPMNGASGIPADVGLEEALSKIDQIGAIRLTSEGNEVPTHYLIYNKQIHVEPADNDDDSVKVYYAARSNVLDALTDTSNIDKQYQSYIVWSALEKIMLALSLSPGSQAFGSKKLIEAQIKKSQEAADLIKEIDEP